MADEFTKAALYGIKTFNKKVKEKIGIEKLIELLNEYEKLNMCRTFIGYYKEEEEITGDIFSIKACELISKKFGFIQRLVENDKIDKKKLDEAERRPMYITDDMFSLYKIDECVIMLLSISDTPIEDLILYLK